MPKLKKTSPARSQSGATTPKPKKSRGSRSLCSPALSTASGRLTSLIDQFKDKNMASFALSPLNRRSVLNDDTDIEEPRRKSWWKKLGENSQDIMEVLEDNRKLDANNVIEEFIDIEVLSQEKKNFTLDLPDSSDNESINSIVLPQRKLFTQKENQPQKKFGQLVGNRETLAKLHKFNTTTNIEPINVGTRELFQNTKRSKPIFPAALLNISPNKTTADKTKENIVEPKPQVRNIFGNRPTNKRKNMFADFIVSESEDDIPEIQPKVFGFQKKSEQRRISSISRGRDPSPTTSITTDTEMDEWKFLPSSTMVENQLDDMVASHTPMKRARLSKLSEAKESLAGNDTNTKAAQSGQNSADDNVNGNLEQEPETGEVERSLCQGSLHKKQETKSEETEDKFNMSKADKTNKNEVNKESVNVTEKNEEVNVSNDHEEEVDTSHENEDESEDNEEDVNESVENLKEVSQRSKVDANETREKKLSKQSKEIENDKNGDEVYQEIGDADEANVRQEVEAASNVSQNIEEKANKSQEIEQQANESEGIDEQANESHEIEERANESYEIEEQANESHEIEEQANESLEIKEQANESQEIAEQADEIEEQANVSDEIEEQANESKEIEKQANESQGIEKQANESVESEEQANESQEIEEQPNESQEIEANLDEENDKETNEEFNESQEVDDEKENQGVESEADASETEEVENDEIEDSAEADKAIASDADMSEQDEDNQIDDMQVDSDDDENEQEIDEDDDESEENQHEINEVEQIEQNQTEPSTEDIEESPNVTHDTTGRNRKKLPNKSPEAILQNKTSHMDSFTAKGRNTSVRSTKSMIKNLNIKPSLAPLRDSVGFSDGTRDSSAEGSGWDSHRTTRKTLRQTFGKDFTPRKSLRALVMEKSAKRQTEHVDLHSETSKFPQANSTEFPEDSNREVEDIVESDHEVSRRTRQTTLEMYLQKMKQQNLEKKLKMEEAVRNSLKVPVRDTFSLFKVPNKPAPRPKPTQSKPKKHTKSIITFGELPSEVIQDMKYKPPKRFQPTNASWITKRLYKFLETKLEAKYDYKARVRAEKLVETIYHFVKDLRRHDVAPTDTVEVLKHELARLDVVHTHFEFYEFFHEFMPREVRVKVVPDIVNKIPIPRHGVFSDILRGHTIQG